MDHEIHPTKALTGTTNLLDLVIELVLVLHDGLPLHKGGAEVIVMKEEWPHIGPQLGLHTPKENSLTQSQVIFNLAIL